MPIIRVSMMEGRSAEQIEEMIQAVTEVVHRTLDAPIESVRVLVDELPKTHWGIAGKTAQKLGR
ncbi:MAG: 4-oxalocrotonate tautomerase [Noviherbaspirillum sp.]